MYYNVYLAPFGTKFITDLIQLIGSARPKSAQIRVWSTSWNVRRLAQA